jgi:hypothetical protein
MGFIVLSFLNFYGGLSLVLLLTRPLDGNSKGFFVYTASIKLAFAAFLHS